LALLAGFGHGKRIIPALVIWLRTWLLLPPSMCTHSFMGKVSCLPYVLAHPFKVEEVIIDTAPGGFSPFLLLKPLQQEQRIAPLLAILMMKADAPS